VEDTLDVWPALPIIIKTSFRMSQPHDASNLNIIDTFKQHDRVCEIDIRSIPNSLLRRIGAINEPFPVLTELMLVSQDKTPHVLPDSFLGGSAVGCDDFR